MPTILEFPQNPSRTSAGDPFRSHISPHLVGYALVIALILVSLVFGPPTMLSGKADVGCGSPTEHTN